MSEVKPSSILPRWPPLPPSIQNPLPHDFGSGSNPWYSVNSNVPPQTGPGFMQPGYPPPVPSQTGQGLFQPGHSPPPTYPDYPLVLSAKNEMTILSPDRSTSILAVHFASSSSSEPTFRVKRLLGAPVEIATATVHSITTSKTDVRLGTHKLRLKKKFTSTTGLGQCHWSKENGELHLITKEKDKGEFVARFVPREAAVGGTGRRLEGRFEIRRPDLSVDQLEEVFVTGLAELERRKRTFDDDGIVEEVLKWTGMS